MNSLSGMSTHCFMGTLTWSWVSPEGLQRPGFEILIGLNAKHAAVGCMGWEHDKRVQSEVVGNQSSFIQGSLTKPLSRQGCALLCSKAASTPSSFCSPRFRVCGQ